MWSSLFVLCVFGAFLGGGALIVPNEIPTLLSLIYSNIPTVKKGTDSRLGWGFRLGDRADFQVLVELGPQTYTRPLGNQPQPNNSNKRNAPTNLSNALYAQRQREKDQISETDGGQWIKTWSQEMKGPQQGEKDRETVGLRPKPGLGVGEIDAKSVIPADFDVESGTNEAKVTEKALDDVSLD